MHKKQLDIDTLTNENNKLKYQINNTPLITKCKNCKNWKQYIETPDLGECLILKQSRWEGWFCASGEE